MKNSTTDDELDAIREKKLKELTEQASRPESPSDPIHIRNAGDFEDVTNEYDVVLVDFHADWCGPCKMLDPIVREVAETTTAALAKVDIDANQKLARKFSVRSVPTVMLYVNGEAVERWVGVQDGSVYKGAVQQYT